MSIELDARTGVFSLTTENSLYQMKADEAGTLLHLYYGARTGQDMSYLLRKSDRGFSGNPYAQQADRGYSLDTLPQEYACAGAGDYRASALEARGEDGAGSVTLRFAGCRATREPLVPEGLPHVRGDAETLEITLRDDALGLRVQLIYRVFPEYDAIARFARLVNESGRPIRIGKAASACVDFPYGRFDAIHFHGRHCMERLPERLPLHHGAAVFGSRRGMSSHHDNPFVILCDKRADEEAGECFGAMLVYSGNHLEEMEVDQAGSVRLVTGIHPDGFCWLLGPGETFDTPEAVLIRSGEGLGGLSARYHRLILERVIPQHLRRVRPVLLNSWEACYFDFDAGKLLALAASAKEIGADMLVLDDGWFGEREDDTRALGDWAVNEKKLGCTLGELSERVHEQGLRFGLWFEPEMVSENSALYRAHPDWALREPGRAPVVARRQLALDMSRPEVVDYLLNAMCAVLDGAKIEYVKWDFNRSLSNLYSHALPPERQGEVAHRFMLGTYALLERLLARYPALMIEGCSGGGGRFDAGMLYYCPQIWCSDDTDAIERLEIQRGTSYGYPPRVMGAHVSAAPNHQTGRSVPLATRGIVAQTGAFGYELDPARLTPQERETIRAQIAEYRRFGELIAEGTFYRLGEEGGDFSAWMFVSPGRDEALVNLVATHVRANGPFPHVRLRGLDPDARYRLDGTDARMTGAALMRGGYSFGQLSGDYPAARLHFTKEAPLEPGTGAEHGA